MTEYEEILGYHLEQAHGYRVELGFVDDRTREIAIAAAGHLGAAGLSAYKRGDVQAEAKLYRSAMQVAPIGWPERARLVARYVDAVNTTGDVRIGAEVAEKEAAIASAAGDELGAALIEMTGLFSNGTLGLLSIEQIMNRSEELLQIFEREGDEWGIEQAKLEIGRHSFFAGQAQRTLELFDAMFREHPENGSYLGWMLSGLYWGPMPAEEGLAFVRGVDWSGSRVREAVVGRVMGGLLRLRGDYDEGRKHLQRSLEIERELGNGPRINSVRGHFFGPLETDAGNFEAAESHMLEAYADMTAQGDAAFSTTVAGNLAHMYVAMGQWQDAERWALLCLEAAQPDDVDATAAGNAALALAEASRGDFESALGHANEAVRIADRTDYLDLLGLAYGSQGEVLAAAGEQEAALRAMTRALDAFETKGAVVHASRIRARFAEMREVGTSI